MSTLLRLVSEKQGGRRGALLREQAGEGLDEAAAGHDLEAGGSGFFDGGGVDVGDESYDGNRGVGGSPRGGGFDGAGEVQVNQQDPSLAGGELGGVADDLSLGAEGTGGAGDLRREHEVADQGERGKRRGGVHVRNWSRWGGVWERVVPIISERTGRD